VEGDLASEEAPLHGPTLAGEEEGYRDAAISPAELPGHHGLPPTGSRLPLHMGGVSHLTGVTLVELRRELRLPQRHHGKRSSTSSRAGRRR
jgi:hypothetical protein